jgi:hypothetical protein
MAKSGRKKAAQTGSNGAATQPQAEPLTTYFRKILLENKKLLTGRSNEEVLKRWQDEHPGQPVTSSVKAAMANAKSAIRSKLKKRRGKKAGQQTQETGTEQAPSTAIAPAQRRGAPKGSQALERLEEAIDDCLDLARELGREEFEGVVTLLRRARREVVWKMGQ